MIFTLGIGGTVGAAGLAAIENGTASKADGIASIAVGVGDQVNSKSTYQGATSIAVGTLNVIDADENSPYDGAASSVVGQANYTKNANAAVIMGAGNKVTNSYREVKLDEKTKQELKQAYQKKDMQKVTEILQKAVPESGGQVMVMGGGNTVTSAYMTQVVGVGNTVTGSGKEYAEGTSTQLNYVDGFYNTLENGRNDYVIGSHNTITGTSVDKNKSNLVLGDNHKLTDRKNNVILGSADDKDTVTDASDAVIIGHNANVSVEGGVAIGSGSVAETGAGIAGYDPLTKANSTSKDTAWTSSWAAVSVGDSTHTRQITNVAAGTALTDAVNVAQLKDVESRVDNNTQAITNLNGHVNRLDNRINKVGAGAAALAGLHPLDFDPSDKWNFAVGYGNYRNANSVAVGAFYRPNEDTMVSVGTNFGNGENMVNAGVSFKLGQGSSYAGVSKAELAEENQKLKANDAAQDQKIQKQEQEIQELKKALEELKSHIK